jgi:prostatic aicd phosphatase
VLSGYANPRFVSRNASEAALDGSDYKQYNMFGSSSPDLPYTTFRDNLAPYGINSLGEWCNKCGTTTARGCDVIDALNDTLNDFASPARTTGRQHVSPVVAGVIGALVGIVAALVFMFVGSAVFKKKSRSTGGAGQYRARSMEAESVSRSDGRAVGSAPC